MLRPSFLAILLLSLIGAGWGGGATRLSPLAAGRAGKISLSARADRLIRSVR